MLYRAVILVLLSFFTHPVRAEQFPAPDPAEACSPSHLKESVLVSGVTFRSYLDDQSGQACLRILDANRMVFQRTNDNDGHFDLGQKASDDGSIQAIPNGTDITGLGRPDMLVSLWTGGAHCCRVDYVFELRPQFRLIAELDARDSDTAHFEAIDGHYDYFASDWSFAYWHSSFAGSPVAPVVLTYSEAPGQKAGFHLALDRMKQPAPSAAEWADALAQVRQELKRDNSGMANELPGVLWNEVLNLIYSGHPRLAWKFLEAAGPKAQQGNNPSLEDFCSTLKTSPYWPDLQPLLQNGTGHPGLKLACTGKLSKTGTVPLVP
ncbi:hypothetical protein [Silvibacterium dinghuense]|uniref:Uncharacterized protein n=1 Tax=Silvibacterium dinghuense TaxID=1560006 RepID=A0A4V1NUX5_9BACT|nr:hypothetical protein [Silvibacterium dinghuense]RXS93774.1 hypothetical protein ESZ00_17155 [Silvibacterium dinghuense]